MNIKIPKGIISETAVRVGKSTTTVGQALGAYETDSNIGVSESVEKEIKETAVGVAKEKLEELECFIKALQ